MRKVLQLIVFIVLCYSIVFSQSAEEKFNQASKLFENGKNKEAITLVQSIEKEVGANPKIYSLYVNAYLADGDYVNAKIALNKFKLLVGDKTSESIKVILDKEREIDEGLAKADKEFAQQQLAEANSIVSSSDRENEEKLRKAANEDPLAELEMWNKVKTSSDALDYHAFLQRFPKGNFTKQARDRMNEIGDPVWNEVKKSNDPFKYREYLQNYPDSPFVSIAQNRYKQLAAAEISWEQIKDSKNRQDFENYVKVFPNSVHFNEANKKRIIGQFISIYGSKTLLFQEEQETPRLKVILGEGKKTREFSVLLYEIREIEVWFWDECDGKRGYWSKKCDTTTTPTGLFRLKSDNKDLDKIFKDDHYGRGDEVKRFLEGIQILGDENIKIIDKTKTKD